MSKEAEWVARSCNPPTTAQAAALPSGRKGFLLSCTGREERDEQDTLDRLHSDVCQVLLCPDKFHSRGLLASAH